jgi:hypothetical protein
MDTIQKVRDFFTSYEDRFNTALRGQDEVDNTAAAFAECFVGASPAGVICGSNDAQFREMIPRGNQFYRDIGTLSMNIGSIKIEQLNSVHFMAKVFWKSVYDKDGQNDHIDFEVVYLLQQRDEVFKIFAYITEDEQKALREHGLIPATAVK